MAIRMYEWDEAKRASNVAKHSVRFEVAIGVFEDHRVALSDASRTRDGETRIKATGMVEGRLLTVVFTRRGDALRLISARRANRAEERSYGDR